MRTLDEVIEIASDWTNGFDESSIEKQMLHYLKMYRSDQIQWEAAREDWNEKWETFFVARERHLDAVKELKRNDPLSWEQLKAMEGKPVWVEMDKPDVIKAWFLICQIDDSFMWVADGKGESHNFPRVCLDTGLWQAYRKERS